MRLSGGRGTGDRHLSQPRKSAFYTIIPLLLHDGSIKMGDYLPGDNLSPRKKCQEKLKPGNKPSTKSGQPFQLSDAGTLVAKEIKHLASSIR